METLGPYRLLAPLGHGGMAAVHLAVRHGFAGFDKLVVVKQILPKYAADPETVSMFLDEARLAARLNHPNLVQTNEVGVVEAKHFLAMEYLDGQPLNRILQRLGAHEGLPLALHLQIIADVLGGLHHAHELTDYDGTSLGVVHGDVNPQNVFVTYEGVVKVFDFGVATARTALTKARPGTIKGKPSYMSPEQLIAGDLDRRADIFAVGVMLWEAATGARPWSDVSRTGMVERVLAGQFPAPRLANPAVSVELEAVILKALAFDRNDRYASAADLQAAVEDHLTMLGGRVSPRELGRMIASHFAPERAELATLVEEELKGCQTSALAESVYPSIDVELSVRSPVTVVVPRPQPLAALDSAEEATLGAPRRVEDAARSTSSPVTTFLSTGTGPQESTLESRAFQPRVADKAERRSGVWAVAAAIVAAVVATVALGPGSGSASASLPSRLFVAEAEVAPPEASDVKADTTTVELQLAAFPADAKLFLDDVPLEGNPYRGDVARDGATHLLRVEASGYVTRTESVTLDRNRFVDVVLATDGALLRGAPRRTAAHPPTKVKISEW